MLNKLLGYVSFIAVVGVMPAQPPSDASIHELLAVTEVQKLIDGVYPQMEQMMQQSMQQALGNRQATAEEEKAMAAMTTKMMKIMHQELSWSQLEPVYVSIYRDAFTQEEIEGLLTFYKSPAGVALVKKMPVVMSKSMSAMQQRMGPIMQKVQSAVQETVQEMEAQRAKSG